MVGFIWRTWEAVMAVSSTISGTLPIKIKQNEGGRSEKVFRQNKFLFVDAILS